MIKRKDQNLSTPCNANFAMGTLNWSFVLLATCTERLHFLAVGRISFYLVDSRASCGERPPRCTATLRNNSVTVLNILLRCKEKARKKQTAY